jgi:uncharacterized protein (DUF1778 family)
MQATKETRLSIRASELEKSILEQAAFYQNQNMSQFILQTSLKVARTLLQESERTRFVVAPEKWEEFCRRLDEPPRDKPALKALLDEPEPYCD